MCHSQIIAEATMKGFAWAYTSSNDNWTFHYFPLVIFSFDQIGVVVVESHVTGLPRQTPGTFLGTKGLDYVGFSWNCLEQGFRDTNIFNSSRYRQKINWEISCDLEIFTSFYIYIYIFTSYEYGLTFSNGILVVFYDGILLNPTGLLDFFWLARPASQASTALDSRPASARWMEMGWYVSPRNGHSDTL